MTTEVRIIACMDETKQVRVKATSAGTRMPDAVLKAGKSHTFTVYGDVQLTVNEEACEPDESYKADPTRPIEDA